MAREMLSVLVVDDDPELTNLLLNYLDAQGYSVLTACGGEEALEILQEKDIDLVLLDIVMPGMDGLQVLQWIRQNHPEIIVVMMSGYRVEDLAQKALRMGASDHISKPLRLEYLDTVIRMLEVLKGS